MEREEEQQRGECRLKLVEEMEKMGRRALIMQEEGDKLQKEGKAVEKVIGNHLLST